MRKCYNSAMTVEHHRKPFLKDEKVKDFSPGLVFRVDMTSGPRDLFLHTPNVAQLIPVSSSPSKSMFYIRDGINHEAKRGLLGGREWYVWRQDSPEEDEKWAPYEEELIRHPLVGQEMMAKLGVVLDGVHKKKGFRVESFRMGDKVFFRTTDQQPTKVNVIAGINANVVGGGIMQDDKLLTVRIREGRYKGHELKLEPKNLYVPIDAKQSEAKEIVSLAKRYGHVSDEQRSQLQAMGYNDNLIMWMMTYGFLSYGEIDRSNEVTQDEVRQLVNHANSLGVDHASADFYVDPRHDSIYHAESSWNAGSGAFYSEYGGSYSGGNELGSSYGGGYDSGGDAGGGFGGGDSGGGGGDAGGGF